MHDSRRMTVCTSALYQIRVQGLLDAHWSDLLGGAVIRQQGTQELPVTELTGRIQDQAALLGILNTLYDLGLPLLSYKCDREVSEPLT